MFDVFIIQAAFIILFRYMFGVSIPSQAVWAALFGTGAIQRLKDYWSMARDVGIGIDFEPSALHSPLFIGAFWWIFYLVTILSRMVFGEYSPFGEILASNPLDVFVIFYGWGMISSILFDVLAFKSRLFYPFSDDDYGFDLVDVFGGAFGYAISVVVSFFFGFVLSFLYLDLFWTNMLF